MEEAMSTEKAESPEKGLIITSTIKNGNDSVNDSGIDVSGEEKGKLETNLTLDCPWKLGQLAWARGSSYPFWPCVVTLDPKTLQYYRVQNKGRSQALMIHVQYFGDGGRHNWVLSHYMMPFSGHEDFKSRTKSITAEIRKKDPKYAAAFSQKYSVRKQWGTGVTEASGLMHLSNEERASMFEPVASPSAEKAETTNKLKRKLSTRESKNLNETTTPAPKKFKKGISDDQTGKLISNSESASESASTLEKEPVHESTSMTEVELGKETPITSRRKSTRGQNKNLNEIADVPKRQYIRKKVPKLSEEEKKRRDEIDFEDYYNLNKAFWKTDYPEASNEEVEKLLRKMWDEMDAEEKKKNLNRNFDDYRYNFTVNQQEVKHLNTNLEENDSKNKENSQQAINNISKVNTKTNEGNPSEKENEIAIPETNDTPEKEIVKDVLQAKSDPQKANITFSETKNDSQKERSDENSKTEVVSQDGKGAVSETESSQRDLENEKSKQNSSNELEKEKVKEVLQAKSDPQKENITFSETKNDSQKERSDENSKTEVVSQDGKGAVSETECSQEGLESEKLKQNSSNELEKEEAVCQSFLNKEDSPLKNKNNETEMQIETAVEDEEKASKIEDDEAEKFDNGEFMQTNSPKESTS